MKMTELLTETLFENSPSQNVLARIRQNLLRKNGDYYVLRSLNDYHPNSEEVVDELLQTLAEIKKACKPFLSQVKNPFSLYRGLNSYDLIVVKEPYLTGRRPRNTLYKFHDALNNFFNKRFGHPYRNGLFATGSRTNASSYGLSYFIFPVGNFDFIWSPEIEDLTVDLELDLDESTVDDVMKVVERADWRTDNLQAAIESGHEIMFWVKMYYAIRRRGLLQDINENMPETFMLMQQYLKG